MKRPVTVSILIVLLAILALGGLFGGVFMLIDPTGASLGMEDVLPLLPVPNYILPGLFLVTVMGLVPLFLAYCLRTRPRWAKRKAGDTHPALTATLWLGITLGVWLTVQAALIGFKWPIQYVTAINGVLIIIFSLLPSVRRNLTR